MKDAYGGSAKGMPLKVAIDPLIIPTTCALSRVTVARVVERAEAEVVAEDDTIDEATDDTAGVEEEGMEEVVEEASADVLLLDVGVDEAKATESTTAS